MHPSDRVAAGDQPQIGLGEGYDQVDSLFVLECGGYATAVQLVDGVIELFDQRCFRAEEVVDESMTAPGALADRGWPTPRSAINSAVASHRPGGIESTAEHAGTASISCGTQDGHQAGLAVWGTGMPGTSVRHPVNLANRRSRCSGGDSRTSF